MALPQPPDVRFRLGGLLWNQSTGGPVLSSVTHSQTLAHLWNRIYKACFSLGSARAVVTWVLETMQHSVLHSDAR